MRLITILIACILLVLNSLPVFAEDNLPASPTTDEALEEELRYLKAETYVITASRVLEDIKKTASSVTVITDRQIRQMGARHLSDVLQTVPGMNYMFHYYGSHLNVARGYGANFGQDLLVMVNSHPVNENYSGSAIWTHDTMMLDNVKRIEVIRGPGSALYGANAFAGVVNIITKKAEDVEGVEITARGGSYDTQQYNLLLGKAYNDLEITFNYNYFDTHGFNGHVNEDLQTTLDRILFTNASLAPNRMKGDDEKHDVSFTLKYRGLTLDGKYVDRERDAAVGLFPVLNKQSRNFKKDYYLNLSYERTLGEGVEFMGKVYRNHNRNRGQYQFFPPGSALLTPLLVPVVMPEGLNDRCSSKNNRTGFEVQLTWHMTGSNTVVAGITYEEMKQYDVRTARNFLSTAYTPIMNIPLRSVRDITHIQKHNSSAKRNFKACFIEDIWDITDTIRFTAGARYDDYSDFGSSFNPRIGLTWQFAEGYDLKLLYGSAFRAPNFMELYENFLGNPDLDPEEVDTYQVSLGAEFTPALSGRVTWFRNRIKDAIAMEMGGTSFFHYISKRKMRSEGLEVEMRYDFGRGTYLAVNYTYHIFRKRFIAWGLQRHRMNVMANIRLSRYLNLYAACHINDGFRRERGDERDDASGYAIFNATLIAKKFLKGYEGLELRASVYNLLNKDYAYPTAQGNLPEDTPMPGRNFLFEIKYKY